jgi:hypothetical protein
MERQQKKMAQQQKTAQQSAQGPSSV